MMWILLVLAALAALARAEGPGFPRAALPGQYEMMFGNTACPEKLELNRAAQIMPVGVECDAASGCCLNLTLYNMDEHNGNQLSMKIANNHNLSERLGSAERNFGEFTIAVLATPMNCKTGNETLAIPKDAVLNFFTPAQTSIINFSAEFNKPKPPTGLAAGGDSHGGGGGGGGEHSAGDGHGHGSGGGHELVSAERLVTFNTEPAAPAAPSGPASNTTATPPPADGGPACGQGIACDKPSTQHEEKEEEKKPNAGTGSGTGSAPAPSGIGLRAGDQKQLMKGVPLMSLGTECMYKQSVRAKCFPASARVVLRDGRKVRMDELETGAEVLVKQGTYSKVFWWTHRDDETLSAFVRVHTSNGHTWTATDGHILYANDKLVEARELRVGDVVRTLDGRATVTKLDIVVDRGLYNPQTVHGDIVVDGVVATTYTSFVPSALAHAALAPLRGVSGLMKQYWYHVADRVIPSL